MQPNETKMHSFFQRQTAKVLAVVMAFSSVFSSGMAINAVRADTEIVNVHETEFINELMTMTVENKVEYDWKEHNDENKVTSRSFIKNALLDVYGTTKAYIVDSEGNQVGDEPTYVDLMAYDAKTEMERYKDMRVCLEGNGKKTYFTISEVGSFSQTVGTSDITENGEDSHSIIADAYKNPGTIVIANGHYSVGLGQVNTKNEIENKYGIENELSTGTDGGELVRWSESAYRFGNNYEIGDSRYMYGKTANISALSTETGIVIKNKPTYGLTKQTGIKDTLVILECESVEAQKTVSFSIADKAIFEYHVGDVEYGIYSDANLQNLVQTFTSVEGENSDIVLDEGKYYLKMLSVPNGYILDKNIVMFDTNSDLPYISLKVEPVSYKVQLEFMSDFTDLPINKSGAKLSIHEYDKNTGEYKHLTDLEYEEKERKYYIPGSYVSTSYGDKEQYISDGVLLYNPNNEGKFKVVKTEGIPGYDNEPYEQEFNILDDVSLIHPNGIYTKENLSVKVHVVNSNGDAINGANVILEYENEDGTKEISNRMTNPSGIAEFKESDEDNLALMAIKNSKKRIGKIYVQMQDHLIPFWALGQTIKLSSYGNVVDGENQTYVDISMPEGTEAKNPFNTLKINKNNFTSPNKITGSKITVFSVCENGDLTIASNKDGEELKDLEIPKNGILTIKNVPFGDYVIKETTTGRGFFADKNEYKASIFTSKSPIEVTMDPAANQLAGIHLQVVDAENNIPLSNAVFALYSAEDMTRPEAGLFKPAGTLLGYYASDEDGNLKIEMFSSSRFEVDGEVFEEVDRGLIPPPIPPERLIAGKYELKHVKATKGYQIRQSNIEIDLSPEDSNSHLLKTGRVKQERQTVSIDFTLNGEQELFEQKTSLNMSAAIQNKMAPTLKGSKWQLIAKENIVDPVTNATIQNGTVVASCDTDENGKIQFENMNTNGFSGKLPSGKYILQQANPSVGYAMTVDTKEIDLSWNTENDNESVLTKSVVSENHFLRQQLKIKKQNGETKHPINGANFVLYNVAQVLDTLQIEKEDLPWNENSNLINGYKTINRDEFKTLVEGKVMPACDLSGQNEFTTDVSGTVTTGEYPYGEYILLETTTREEYGNPSDCYYIEIPGIKTFVSDGYFMTHNIVMSPDSPNLVVSEDVTKSAVTSVAIVLVDEETKEPIQHDATFSFAQNMKEQNIINVVNGYGVTNITHGNYTIVETQAPTAYYPAKEYNVVLGKDIAQAMLKNDTENVAEYYMTENGMYVKIYVENGKRPETCARISVFESLDNGEQRFVPGVHLQLLDEHKNVVTDWVTTADDSFDGSSPEKNYHEVKFLEPGTYYIHEIKSCSGFVSNKEDVEITIKAETDVQEFSVKKYPTITKINLLDNIHSTNIENTKISLYNQNPESEDVEPLKTFTITDNGITVEKLPVGLYYVELKNPLIGYKTQIFDLNVNDQIEDNVIDLNLERMSGTFEITKLDSKTNEPIKGIKYDIVSKYEVVDQITQEIIFNAGDVVASMETNKDGYASIENLQIGTYGKQGFVEPITYELVQTYAPDDYAVDKARVFGFAEMVYPNPDNPEEWYYKGHETGDYILTDSIVLNIKNNKPKLEISVATNIPIPNNTTAPIVIGNTEKIAYNVVIKNTGDADANNVSLKVAIPSSVKVNVLPTEAKLYGVIADCHLVKIPAGTTKTLSFVLEPSDPEKAQLIELGTEFIGMNIKKEETEKKSNDLGKIILQTVSFEQKDIEMKNAKHTGTKQDGQLIVSPSDVITVSSVFKNAEKINDVLISSLIKTNAAEYVSGSAKINGKYAQNAKYNKNNGVLSFGMMNFDSANEIVLEYDLKVNDLKNGEDVLFKTSFDAVIPRFKNSQSIISKGTEHKAVYADKKYEVTLVGEPETTTTTDMTSVKNSVALKAGQQMKYKINVINKGKSPLKNLTLVALNPDNVTFTGSSFDNKLVTSDHDQLKLEWNVNKLMQGASTEIEIFGIVNKQIAELIDLQIAHGTSRIEGGPIDPFSSDKSNHVVYQTLSFKKTAQVEGGTNDENATPIASGDIVQYVMELVNKDNLFNVSFADQIPEGMSYVKGSLEYQKDSGEWESLKDEGVVETITTHDEKESPYLVTYKFENLEEGVHRIRFKVKVDHVAVNSNIVFRNSAVVTYTSRSIESTPDTLKSEMVTHMVDTSMSSDTNGSIQTFCGDYDQRQNVAVVQDRDIIEYTISVKNAGASAIKNLVVENPIPEHTTFSSVDEYGNYIQSESIVRWEIDKLEKDQELKLKFKVKVASEGDAEEIVSKARYAVPADIENVDEDEWQYMDSIVYQTIQVRFGSSVDYGEDGFSAKYVPIKTKFTYTIFVKNKNDIYDFSVSDVIPKGLEFVKGSAKYILSGGNDKSVDISVDNENKIVFPKIGTISAGTSKFMFDVIVSQVKEQKRDYFFLNNAVGSLSQNNGSENKLDIKTNTVALKTIDGDEIIDENGNKQPVLGFDTTSKAVVWSIIALFSILSMCGFAYYGYLDKKEKKDKKQ